MTKILCPTSCEVELPSFKFEKCSPEFNNAQISKVYFTKGNAPSFTDVSSATEWATRLGNDSTVVAHDIRVLTGKGSKPKASASTAELSLRRKVTTSRTHSLSFKVDETNQENHDAMRQLQCGGNYKIWYETIGGLLFGGNDGLVVTIDAGANHGEGNDDIITHEYVFEWNDLHDPERNISPL